MLRWDDMAEQKNENLNINIIIMYFQAAKQRLEVEVDMEVYLDNSATTRCLPEVAALMTKIMCEDYGNPSSMHFKGVESEKYLRYARETIARCLKVQEKEILFTSGGTESDNIALIGTAYANCRAGRHIITTQIEHPGQFLQTWCISAGAGI